MFFSLLSASTHGLSFVSVWKSRWNLLESSLTCVQSRTAVTTVCFSCGHVLTSKWLLKRGQFRFQTSLWVIELSCRICDSHSLFWNTQLVHIFGEKKTVETHTVPITCCCTSRHSFSVHEDDQLVTRLEILVWLDRSPIDLRAERVYSGGKKWTQTT